MTPEQFRQEVARLLKAAGYDGDADAFAASMDAEAYIRDGVEAAYAIDEESKTWDQEVGHYV